MHTFKQLNITELDYFIDSITEKFPYQDVFITELKTVLPEHTHDDYEARLFLEGDAVFCVDGIEYSCSAGSYIEISPGTKHSFKHNSKETLKVLRFFTDPSGWSANFCVQD